MDFVNLRIGDIALSGSAGQYTGTITPISNSFAKQILSINHGYKYITIDNENANGFRFIFFYDSPSNNASYFFARSGSVIPIDEKRSLWVLCAYIGGTPIEAAIAGSSSSYVPYEDDIVTFWCLKADEQGAYVGPNYKLGERVRSFYASELAPASGSSFTILDSDNLRSMVINQPLSLKFRVMGGRLASLTDFPYEVVLTEWQAGGGGGSYDLSRTWLAPGDAIMDVVVPLGINRRYGVGQANRWLLEIVHPAGGSSKTGVNGFVKIFGEIIVGTLPYSNRLQFFYRNGNLGTPGTTPFLSVNYDIDQCPDRLIDGQTVNGAATGAINITRGSYIPSRPAAFGGPRRDNLPVIACATATTTQHAALQATIARHMIMQYAYAAAPTGTPSISATFNFGGR